MECYVKTADGTYHWNRGMHVDLHVTDEVTDVAPPVDPDVEITPTDAAMTIDGSPVPGRQTVAVHFQQESPGLTGKDLHVASLAPDTDVSEIVAYTRAGSAPADDDLADLTFLP